MSVDFDPQFTSPLVLSYIDPTGQKGFLLELICFVQQEAARFSPVCVFV